MTTDTGPTPLQWFLAELDKRVGDEIARRQVVDLLESMVGQRLVITRRDIVRPGLVDAARRMLDAGSTPSQVRVLIATRATVSRPTASRIVSEALARRAEQAAAARSATRQGGRGGETEKTPERLS